MQWIAIPRPWVDEELQGQWTKDNPAPDLMCLAMLCARHQAGKPWGKSKLVRWSGVSDWKARNLLRQAADWMSAQGSGPTENQPRSTHVSTGNQPETNRRSSTITDSYEEQPTEVHAGFHREPTGLARASSLLQYNTSTIPVSDMGDTPKPPARKSKKKNTITGHGSEEVRAVWDALNKQRQKYRPGARGITLQRSWAATLRDQLKISTPGDIMRAYRYFSEGDGARWWQDNDLDLHAMMTRRTMERMMAESTDWSPEADIQRQRKQIEEAF